MTPIIHRNEPLSTSQFSQATRATQRQLQWWDEHGWLKPAEHFAHRRRYDRTQIRLGKLLVATSRATGSPQVGRIVRELRRKKLMGIRLCRYVAWDREAHVFVSDSEAELIRFLVASRSGWWVVDVEWS